MYECPTCGLETHKEIDERTELEVNISYKSPGKQPYSRGWFGCLNCLSGLEKCIQDYMNIQRINRGISLRNMREQKGCGCGG